MTEELPTKDNQGGQHYGNADTSVLARYESGEIDIYTLVALLPESAIPQKIQALYQTIKTAIEAPHARGEVSDKAREARHSAFLREIEQWRLDRGPGYVEAYVEFKKTGEAIAAGESVFESDWFLALQQSRETEIEELKEKAATGDLSAKENDRLVKLMKDHKGDQQVASDWKSLSNDYEKLKEREQSRSMSEGELRKEEAKLKRRMFEQLDKASPELREKLLQEISAANPSFRSEYAEHAQGRGEAPSVSQNSADLAKVKNPEALADPDMQDLVSDLTGMEWESSTAKRHGFASVEASVVAHDHFAAAVASPSMADSPTSEQTLARTVRGPNRDLT